MTRYISNRPAMTTRTQFTVLSFEGIAVLVIMSMFISVCGGYETAVDSAVSDKARSVSSGTAPREKISLEGIRLKSGGSLSPNSAPILDSAAEILRNKPNTTRYYVETYCARNAGDSARLRSSRSRATAVTTYLEARGISSNRLIPRECGIVDVAANNSTSHVLHGTANHTIELIQIDN
jgi:hypothetical protein